MVEVRRIFHKRIPIPGVLPLTTQGYIEIGAYEIRGTGFAEIRFKEKYNSTPAVVKEGLGYISIWGLKIPVPTFVTSINTERIRLFNVGTKGTNTFVFIAVGT